MIRLAPRRWVKRYATAVACRSAAAHHHWLADLGAPVPTLYTPGEHHLEFEHIVGRHAQPCDLPRLASLLGWLHRTAYTTDLHRARLDRPHTTSTGLRIPDFLSSRRTAITSLLTSGLVPGAPFTADQAVQALQAAAQQPACLYKDSNPRNFLITTTAGQTEFVLVDFDILTLAPAGYNLAKLIVTLTMTHGPLPITQMRAALTAYNTALTDASTGLPSVPWTALMTWAGIHHILTSPTSGAAAIDTPGHLRHRWESSPPVSRASLPTAEHERLIAPRGMPLPRR